MNKKSKITFPLLNSSIFAMVSMTMLIAISISLLLYKEYTESLKSQQLEFSENISNRSMLAIQKAIKGYETILRDYSNFPLLKLAVVQPENSLEDAVDLIKSFSFLGEKFQTAICDFEGRPLHDFFNSKKLTLEVYNSIKDSKKFSASKHINHNDSSMLLLSVPIEMRNSIEGALCVLIPTKKLITLAIPKNEKAFSYEIYNGSNLISEKVNENKKVHKTSIKIFDQIYLNTYLDPSTLKEEQNQVFKKLFLSLFLIITLISLLTFLLTNRFLLRPIVSLGEMTYSVTQNHNSQPIAIDSPIKELFLLKEDIKTMITTMNKRSDQLNDANNELEQRVKKRTKDLEQKAEELEKLSKYKSEFLARMSHEIRTPMNAIIGYTDILKENIKDNENRNQLKIISNSADALLTVINDILDFSKIEAGMMTIEKIPFNLNILLDDINHLFSKTADDKGLKFEVNKVSSNSQWLSGDPHRIRQILINLTGNAIKFTNKGEVLVKTEVDSLNNDKLKLDIVIQDSGIGIPKDKIEDIFNSFSQAEGSVSRQYGGTGLGLPISKELAELMGGSLNVFSKTEEGTTFRFSVILDKSEPVQNPMHANQKICWSRDPNILLVDDNIVNIKLAEKTLKNFNVNTTSCTSGHSAIETLENDKGFDLILMDCQMPEMDGLEATRLIRKMSNFKETPIIAFTANALKEEIEDCYKAGMNDYISKPFKKELFCEKLRQWLNHLIELNDKKVI